MSLSSFRRTGHAVYRHVKRGLREVDSIVHKAALVYSLTHPLLQQAFDTSALDSGLLDSYEKYQTARELASKTDRIVN
jgi:hypothetical protein